MVRKSWYLRVLHAGTAIHVRLANAGTGDLATGCPHAGSWSSQLTCATTPELSPCGDMIECACAVPLNLKAPGKGPGPRSTAWPVVSHRRAALAEADIFGELSHHLRSQPRDALGGN
jgi:hypothetical protein